MAFQRGEVAVTGLLNYLRKQFRGKKDRPELLRFMTLLIAMTFLLCLHRLSGTDRDDFDLSSRVKDMLDSEKFYGIKEEEDYYAWVKDTVIEALWTADDPTEEAKESPVEEEKEKSDPTEQQTCNEESCQNQETDLRPNLLPMAVLVIRQFRVETRRCVNPAAINMFPQTMVDHMKQFDSCVLTLAESGDEALDSRPYGNLPYKIVKDTPQPLYSIPVQGPIGSYNKIDMAFTQAFYYNESISVVKEKISELQREHWTGLKTRALILEVILYSQATKSFVHAQVLSEVSARGTFQSTYMSYPFSFEDWVLTSYYSWFLLLLDVATVVWWCHAVWTLIFIVVTNWEMLSGFSEGASVIFLVVMFLAYVQRFHLWLFGFDLSSLNYLEKNKEYIQTVHGGNEHFFLFDRMVYFGQLYQHSFTWFSVAYLCAWTRLLVYLRHNPRLNALTETMQQCAGQLLGMGVVGLLVQMGFVAVGNVMYGNQIEQFRSLRASFGTLQAILIGIFDTWDDMQTMHPIATPIFVTSYFLICWLILLNMVVGVIGASFDAVQENMEDPDWNVKHMAYDLYYFVTGAEANVADDDDEGSVALPTMPTLANIITTLEETPGTHITPDDFKAILPPDVAESQAEAMLEGGRHEFAGKTPTTMNMERAVETIYERVEKNAEDMLLVNNQFTDILQRVDNQCSKLEALESKVESRMDEIIGRLETSPRVGSASRFDSKLDSRVSSSHTEAPMDLGASYQRIADMDGKLNRLEGSLHTLQNTLGSQITQIAGEVQKMVQLHASTITRVEEMEQTLYRAFSK